jgi:hypothetical protein
MLGIKKESAWTFVTSSTGGIGVEFVAVEGGALFFQDPSGAPDTFYYGAAGAGLSFGLKLPKIGKIQIKNKSVGAVIAPNSFPNMGKLYILETFDGDELAESDIEGVCMFVEIGGGLIVGGSATAMILGMNPLWLPTIVLPPPMSTVGQQMLIKSATGLLVMAGVTAGVQAGGGIGAFIGGIY